MSETAPQGESSQRFTPDTLPLNASFNEILSAYYPNGVDLSTPRTIAGWHQVLNPVIAHNSNYPPAPAPPLSPNAGFFSTLLHQRLQVQHAQRTRDSFDLPPPSVQWPPPMEFHNVTESDMRERGKAAAAAGKSMESPFVINQGLPPEYRQSLPQVQPTSNLSTSSLTPPPTNPTPSPSTTSWIMQALASPQWLAQYADPPPTQPLPSYLPPAPATSSHHSNAGSVHNRPSLTTARKSNEPSAVPLRTPREQPTPTPAADPTSSTSAGPADPDARAKRLKMFQETSEESFEESLMNGGYGMYRTSDLVSNRDSIPVASPAQTNTNSSTPISLKDARKRKRLAAFLKQPPNPSKEDEFRKESEERLKIVVVEGIGRVLSPVSPSSLYKLPVQPLPPPSQPEEALPKKRGGYRKRRPKDSSTLEKPDWPDNNFFWRSRTEERERERRFELDEKMRMIHGYLDSSDDEDKENEPNSESNRPIWRFVTLPEGEPEFPPVSVDHSDAREVLFSKKNTRLTNPRHTRKGSNDSDIMDIGDGPTPCGLGEDCRSLPPDSDLTMVECENCYKWFHLECVGISSFMELGQHWYCERCDDDMSETPKGLEHLYHSQSDSSPQPEVPFDINDPSTPSNAFSSSPLYPVTPNSVHRGTDTTNTPSKPSDGEWTRPLKNVTEIA